MEGYVGEIRYFAGLWTPKDWSFCQGQTLQINEFTALFSIIGTTYGGNGTTNFMLPDLRGRIALGGGQGLGLTNRLTGSTGGEELTQLSSATMPKHSHIADNVLSSSFTMQVSSSNDSINTAGTNSYIGTGGDMPEIYREGLENPVSMPPIPITIAGNTEILQTGGGQPHYNMQPYTVIDFIICLNGTYPMRP